MEVAATPSQCLSKLLFFTLTQFNEFVKITFGTLCLLIDDVAGRFLAPPPPSSQELALGLGTVRQTLTLSGYCQTKFNLPPLC